MTQPWYGLSQVRYGYGIGTGTESVRVRNRYGYGSSSETNSAKVLYDKYLSYECR